MYSKLSDLYQLECSTTVLEWRTKASVTFRNGNKQCLENSKVMVVTAN